MLNAKLDKILKLITPVTSVSKEKQAEVAEKVSRLVVFPAPFGPKMPKISPFSTAKETPRTASKNFSPFF
jgi:hypothetical protein